MNKFIDSYNCVICGNEYNIIELRTILASAGDFKICSHCLAISNPDNDYEQVKSIVYGYLKFSQQLDPELSSPEIKIEPVDTYIQKAVDLLKKVNPSYFIGVRKIVADTGAGFGHVSSGGGQDPAVIHINLPKIKTELQSKLRGAPQDQFDKEFIRQIAITISHEKGHVVSFKPESGFPGEQPAESEEHSMATKIDNYYNAMK